MKNTSLNVTILKILARIDTGLKEKTLQNEVEIAMDRPDLTTDEFLDALVFREDRGLVDNWKTTSFGYPDTMDCFHRPELFNIVSAVEMELKQID